MRKSKSLALGFLLGTLVAGGALGFSLDRVLTRPACDANTDRQAVRAYMASKLQLSLFSARRWIACSTFGTVS